MVELSIVVPSLAPKDELEVMTYLNRSEFDDYEVIVRDDYPVTKARNEGYKRANSEKIVFLDDDSRPRPEYLREVSETLGREVAVAGRTVHPNDDLFRGQLTAHYDFGDEPRYVSRFWGCNMAVRREVLEEVGGWDEAMGWGHEEKELADRILEQYDIYYNPDMVVDHVYADSMRDFWVKQYKLEVRTPYYWSKRGLSRGQMWRRIVSEALDPRRYVGRSLELLAARTGRQLAGTVGRVVGMRRQQTPVENAPGSHPTSD
jgi:GT2 family glycosyltransferase